ncbi:MAG: DUF116 domain-containing protein [Halobacteriota archaeon]|nr:DUF116 domain-containing protein [Halobacteriota archaeon]
MDSIDIGLLEREEEDHRIIEVEFHNSSEMERFETSSPFKRVLILPHCMKRTSTCSGSYTKYGFNCVYCDKTCPTFKLKTFAEVLGYKVFIAPGANILKKYIDTRTPEGIVYVACYEELVSGLNLIRSKRPEIPVLVATLSKTGCSNTTVDVEKVKNILRIPRLESQEL